MKKLMKMLVVLSLVIMVCASNVGAAMSDRTSTVSFSAGGSGKTDAVYNGRC